MNGHKGILSDKDDKNLQMEKIFMKRGRKDFEDSGSICETIKRNIPGMRFLEPGVILQKKLVFKYFLSETKRKFLWSWTSIILVFLQGLNKKPKSLLPVKLRTKFFSHSEKEYSIFLEHLQTLYYNVYFYSFLVCYYKLLKEIIISTYLLSFLRF